MSRSYKKVYVWKDTNDKYFKRLSNRKIRYYPDLPIKSGRWKHISNLTYSICDYKSIYWSERDFRQRYNLWPWVVLYTEEEIKEQMRKAKEK